MRSGLSSNSAGPRAALATLREHLDFDTTEVDAQGRYVLDFEAMNDIADALDDIEEALGEEEAEAGE